MGLRETESIDLGPAFRRDYKLNPQNVTDEERAVKRHVLYCGRTL